MKIRTGYSLIGAAVAAGLLCTQIALAQADKPRERTLRHTSEHPETGLVGQVRESTQSFLDAATAESAGYGPFLGCTSGAQAGAMGLHYANPGLLGDGALDASQPEVLVYEPMNNGRLRLVAVEYVTIAEAWDANNPTPPVLMGQLFHYNGSPNRYGLPPHYALHVWAWKGNPNGMFAHWNPRVSCEHYAPDS